MGIAFSGLLDWNQGLSESGRKLVAVLLLAVVPAVAIMGQTREIMTLTPFTDAPMCYQQFGAAIGQNTPEGAVVLIPNESRTPVYYSRRHVIRGVVNDAIFDSIRSRVAASFPGAPEYLALQPRDISSFPHALQQYQLLTNTPDLVLLRIDTSAGGTRSARTR